MPLLSRILTAAALFLAPLANAASTNVVLLVPGFTVTELPVRLSNINNLRFAPNGRLTALGYDGRVHLLSDSDGDGVEDRDTLFWDKPTLTVPVGMAWSAEGLYISSHGKVSLLRDADGDGRADVEEIIATGWPPTDVGTGGVDATAVTLDAEGNVYFGLLTPDYSNPYRVKEGVSHYDIGGPRGTIRKWSRSTRQLETIATGIRVPYTLAFNRSGDLFLTDQEGETWCPGGNPLDELNHIVPGRNYGFPPAHDTYLPHLISEPPVVGFGPQHQSACGLVFNEPSQSRGRFGPVDWEGDAFVTGESRGKLWRVRLVKTPHGYIGAETLLARIDMLATDAAISPGGDLYLSCHSGKPDWGTGPNGAGKIFKIQFADAKAPQPAGIWPSGVMELSIAFDRPIDPTTIRNASAGKIEFGEFVSAADRLEVLKPPYKTVQQQDAAPRGSLRIAAARLSADGRTLTLATDPHPQAARYALTLPGVKGADQAASATIDLAYSLNGVAAEWSETTGTAPQWSGWLPHIAPAVSAAFTRQSAQHEKLARLARRDGVLKMRSRVQLAARSTLRIEAPSSIAIRADGKTISVRPAPRGRHSAEIINSGAEISWLLTEIEARTGTVDSFDLVVSTSSERDPTPRPLPLTSLLLPWVPQPRPPEPPAAATASAELAGGDFETGRALFFGDRLKCSTCHRIRGEGALIGPDLSNLTHRDAASVLQDIREPSTRIHPDYVAYTVHRRGGGEDWTGFVRTQDEAALRIIGADGKELVLQRAEVSELRPSPISLMPSGLLDALKEGEVRSLLTFLLHEPPARTQADVDAVLSGADSAGTPAGEPKPLQIVLVAGKQDHGPGQHDYPAWQKTWGALLARKKNVTVSEAWEWPEPDQWRTADAVVFYLWNHNWSAARLQQLDTFQNRGGGIVILHSATIADKEPEQLATRIGLAAQPGPTKYLHTPLVLAFTSPKENAITRGFKSLPLLDEPYWPMFGDTNRIQILASARVDGEARPLIWTFQKGQGRVFGSILGHYTWTLDDPLFRILALRGLGWASGERVERLLEK